MRSRCPMSACKGWGSWAESLALMNPATRTSAGGSNSSSSSPGLRRSGDSPEPACRAATLLEPDRDPAYPGRAARPAPSFTERGRWLWDASPAGSGCRSARRHSRGSSSRRGGSARLATEVRRLSAIQKVVGHHPGQVDLQGRRDSHATVTGSLTSPSVLPGPALPGCSKRPALAMQGGGPARPAGLRATSLHTLDLAVPGS